VIESFGETAPTGGAGGTGIALYKRSIYAEINDRIVRYSLSTDSVVPKIVLKRSSPNCLWVAIIPCIPSLSVTMDPAM
jgi:hypothetical protein